MLHLRALAAVALGAGERIAAHQIRATATLRDGRRGVDRVRTRVLEYAEAVAVDVVQITAVVTDGQGRFVRGLKQSDFTVTEDGKPQKITHFAAEHIPLELARAEGSDATIYVIGQGRSVHSRPLQKLLQQLADISGGRAFFSNDPAKLRGMFAEILEDIRNQYLVAYPAPDSRRDGGWHEIKVEVTGGNRHHVRARQGYRLTRR